MKARFIAIVAALTTAGLAAGCASGPPPPPRLGPGALPNGMATFTINDAAVGVTQKVDCTSAGNLTTVSTGDTASGVTAVISSSESLSAVTVDINDVGGFTGSYHDGISSPQATVTRTDRTYDISGTADGFKSDNPSARTSGTFTIQVAC